jgi:hypothetical protein
MSNMAFTHLMAGAALGALVCASALAAAPAQNATPPDFSAENAGWVSIGTDYVAVPGGPKPVTFDPAHRYVPNGSGEQRTFRVADLNNPVLTQFAKDALKTSNDMVLRGFAMYARESRCWMTGVPVYLLNPAQPTFILQEPKKITMMWQMDQQVRHIYMNCHIRRTPSPHGTANPSAITKATRWWWTPSVRTPRASWTITARPIARSCMWSSASISSRAAKRCRPISPSRTRSRSPSRSMSCINGGKFRGP